MKKLLGIVVLGLLCCNFANAKIIFRNCKLTPNINASTFFIIDLEKNLIREEEPGKRIAHWKINKIFNELIITQEPIDVTDYSDEMLVITKRNITQKLTFNLADKTVSHSVVLDLGADERFRKMFEESIKSGELVYDVSSTCDAENL